MNASFKKSTDKMTLWREHPSEMVRDLFHIEPDPWQIEALEAFPHHPRLAMKACKGPGKAQPGDTRINTPKGEISFGMLQPGDRIFAGDGSVTTVRGTYERGVLPVYRIWFDDGSSTRACGEHLWKVKGRTERRHDTWSVLTTEEIIKRGVREKNGRWAGRHFEIPRQGAAQYPHADLPLDPYVLGVWLGDGVRETGRYATKPTAEIEQEIQRRGYETSGAKDGIVNVYGIIGHLRQMRLAACYSHERFIPSKYRHASVAQRHDMICGLMDTDGGIGRDGHMEYATTSGRLADHVVWLVRSLGGVAFRKKAVKKPFYYGKDREKIAGRDCYRVTVRLPFNPFRVPHRRSRWTDPAKNPSTVRYMTRKIDRIEPDGEAWCRCIEVEHPDHTYLTDDSFIVTHNTAIEAWIGWNFLLTRPYPKCAATSISGQNLKDNFWAEMAKWQSRSPMLMRVFEWTAQRISHRKEPENWFMSARTWPQSADSGRQADTLAGFHADYVLFILDESGGIPSAVMVSAEAALSSCIEGHIVQAGNPTMLSGPLYAACTSERRLWKVIEITGDPDDPKRSTRINVQWARDQIEKYGRDNPWVLVNVFGQFPPSSLNVLIGPDEVTAAMNRGYKEYDIGKASKIMGVDVARYGDDSSVIARRQGVQMFNFDKKRNLESTQGAGWVSRTWDEWGAHACFIDMTGGHGAGWYDQLRVLGKAPIGVQYAGEPHEKSRYHNKRAEMAFDFVNWIKNGGALPNSPELMAALTQTTYTFHKDRFLLQPKDEVKLAIGYSPDEFDAAMQTFAEPVTPPAAIRRATPMRAAYNAFAEMDGDSGGQNQYGGRHRSDYNPFQGD